MGSPAELRDIFCTKLNIQFSVFNLQSLISNLQPSAFNLQFSLLLISYIPPNQYPMKNLTFLILIILFLSSCMNESVMHQKEVQEYLDVYNNKYKELYTASSEGQWKVQTHIVAGDSTNANNARIADEAMAKYTGSKVKDRKSVV